MNKSVDRAARIRDYFMLSLLLALLGLAVLDLFGNGPASGPPTMARQYLYPSAAAATVITYGWDSETPEATLERHQRDVRALMEAHIELPH